MRDQAFSRSAGWVLKIAVACLTFMAFFAIRGEGSALEGMIVADGTSLVDMDNAMKIIFEDSVFDNTVHDSELMDQFEQDGRIMTEETTGGRYIETAQYFNLPAGVRSVATRDKLPIPDGPVIENSRVYLKKIAGVVEMDGDVMRRVRTNEGAFLDWGQRALPDLVKRLNDLMDREMLGSGTGILARVASGDAGTGTPLSIDRNFGVTGLTGAFLNFLEGKSIVFSSAADGDPLREPANPAAQVTDAYEGSLTLDRFPAGVVAGDYIFEGDTTGGSYPTAAGVDREFMGLLGMVDDGTVLPTFQEIIRANFRKWQALRIDATADGYGGELSEDLIVKADDDVFVLGGGKPDLFITSRANSRTYWRKLRADRVINDPRGGFTGGQAKDRTRIELGDRDLVLKVARKMPDELAFACQRDVFKRWQLGKWTWDDLTGSIWNRVVDGGGRYDAFFATGYLYIQMGCFGPRKNYQLYNLSPTS